MNAIKCRYITTKFFKNLNHHNKLCQRRHLTNALSKERHQNRVQNLVIDLSFEDLMTTSECHRLARDLFTICCLNSLRPTPKRFDVNLCHQIPENSITIEYLRHYLPQIQTIDNFNIVKKSYSDLYPTERLVYLSGDAKDCVEFNDNEIYIIGGLVQKKIFKKDSNRVTYMKAVREGINVRKFPIDHFISDQMKRGIVLFLPQVFNILLDVKTGNDWESAVRRHLPEWKLKLFDTASKRSCHQ